jgi:hypothetical protein
LTFEASSDICRSFLVLNFIIPQTLSFLNGRCRGQHNETIVV